MSSLTLDKLLSGQQAIIKKLTPASRLFRHRLLAMGIIPGCKIILVRATPFGDPLEISARGFSLSLRRSEASTIIVDEVKE